LFESKKDWGKAQDAFQNALAIKPNDPIASDHLANVMLESGGNFDVALSLAQNARRGMPIPRTSPTPWAGSTIKKAHTNRRSTFSTKP